MVMELREVHLDALAGGGVEETPAAGSSKWFREKDPPSGMESAVKAAVCARFSRTLTPPAARCTEAEVVRDVTGEDALGDQPSRPITKISPVSPAVVIWSWAAAESDGGACPLGPPRIWGRLERVVASAEQEELIWHGILVIWIIIIIIITSSRREDLDLSAGGE